MRQAKSYDFRSKYDRYLQSSAHLNVDGAIKPSSSASRPELSFGSRQRHTHGDDTLIHTEDEIEDALEESGPEDRSNDIDIGKLLVSLILPGIILQMLFMWHRLK